MKLAGVRVLVTGGAGFIGSHIVEHLVSQGARVRILDNFSSGSRANLMSVLDDVEIVTGDLRDAAVVRSAVRGCAVVSHQAAQLEITRCLEDPIDDLQSNTVTTLNVLDAVAKADVQRLIYASSACVYGQPLYIPSDEAKHPTNPNWAYGVSKLACEKYSAIYHELTGIPMTGLRYAIVYGPREWYGRVLTIFLKRLMNGAAPVIFGDGKQVRDFIYVKDLVALHDRILQHDLPGHEILNVSTGTSTSVADLARVVIESTGMNRQAVHEEIRPGERSQLVENGRLRLPSELTALVLDPAKAQALAGMESGSAVAGGSSSGVAVAARKPPALADDALLSEKTPSPEENPSPHPSPKRDLTGEPEAVLLPSPFRGGAGGGVLLGEGPFTTPEMSEDMGAVQLSILFPAYNEAAGIREVILEAEEALQSSGLGYELIVLDDASRDNTWQILQELAQKIPSLRLLRHERNQGIATTLHDLFVSAQDKCSSTTAAMASGRPPRCCACCR